MELSEIPILKKPKLCIRIGVFAITIGYLFVVIAIIASLILSPFFFGYLWYHVVAADPISSAIIGVACGAGFDFFVLVILR